MEVDVETKKLGFFAMFSSFQSYLDADQDTREVGQDYVGRFRFPSWNSKMQIRTYMHWTVIMRSPIIAFFFNDPFLEQSITESNKGSFLGFFFFKLNAALGMWALFKMAYTG